ncbi:uncharacterized protein LOC128393730 [Panonychus citri]|uniref:uncharacterized protein LOC128393730 n=1 Tax=Panonychus citri TaxID=50023 RepID=UPI00230731A4|nr:uncharacterized protein LOC128393730 [Panonychus citri]
MRLLWFHYIFSQLYILTLLLIVSSRATTIKDNLPSSSSQFVDLFYSDSNDRNIRYPVNQPGTNDQQVIYINHGNGAISSIRRSSNQKLPFSPHVTSYPSSVFDNNNQPNHRENDNFKVEPIPLIENYPEVNEENPTINPKRDEIDHRNTLTPQPNRRPSRRSAATTPANEPSRLIYEPQPSSLSPPPIPSPSPPPTVSSLKPQPPSNLSPSIPLPPRTSVRGGFPAADPFSPFNLDSFFTRDPSFDIERNVIGNQDNPQPPSRPRPSPLTNHRARFTNNESNQPPPPPPPPPPSAIVDNDANRLDKPEDERTTAEPRIRKQAPNTGSPPPPSAYSGRPSIPPAPVTTPSPILGPIGGTTGRFQGPTFGPTLGGEDGNSFLPSYGPGFGLPGGQDIFPFFETPFLPISPTSSSNEGFQRRRLANNNYHNQNNLGAYGNPRHHPSSSSPPPPPASSLNNVNENSIGNGAGYPSYTIYKGGDDDDAGVKWPKIFKFTDGRVNLSEFERNKKSGKIKFNNKEDAYFDDIRRDSFLILHGGTYN